MSRGKKARQSQNRRDWEALERRAVEAEQRAEKLATELGGLRASTDQMIANLRDQVRDLTRQRDEAASPALEAARSELDQMRRQMESMHAIWGGGSKAFADLSRHAKKALRDAGVSEDEIRAIWARARGELEVGMDQQVELAVNISGAARRRAARELRRIDQEAEEITRRRSGGAS